MRCSVFWLALAVLQLGWGSTFLLHVDANTPDYRAASTARHLQRFVDIGARHIVVDDHLDVARLKPPRHCRSNGDGELAASGFDQNGSVFCIRPETVSIRGNCSELPADYPDALRPLRARQCAVRVNQKGTIFGLTHGDQKLWLEGLYLHVPDTVNSSIQLFELNTAASSGDGPQLYLTLSTLQGGRGQAFTMGIRMVPASCRLLALGTEFYMHGNRGVAALVQAGSLALERSLVTDSGNNATALVQDFTFHVGLIGGALLLEGTLVEALYTSTGTVMYDDGDSEFRDTSHRVDGEMRRADAAPEGLFLSSEDPWLQETTQEAERIFPVVSMENVTRPSVQPSQGGTPSSPPPPTLTTATPEASDSSAVGNVVGAVVGVVVGGVALSAALIGFSFWAQRRAGKALEANAYKESEGTFRFVNIGFSNSGDDLHSVYSFAREMPAMASSPGKAIPSFATISSCNDSSPPTHPASAAQPLGCDLDATRTRHASALEHVRSNVDVLTQRVTVQDTVSAFNTATPLPSMVPGTLSAVSAAAAPGIEQPPGPLSSATHLQFEELHVALDAMQGQGVLLYGRFRVLGAVERRMGGQGLVQFVYDTADAGQYAVKFFLHRSAFEHEQAILTDPTLREVVADNAVDIFSNDSGKHRSPQGLALPPSIVTERGQSLNEWLRSARPRLATIVDAMLGVVQRLEVLHSLGIVHRDVKPGNVIRLISQREHGWALIDFGSAARVGRKVGLSFSLKYAAPETICAYEQGAAAVAASPAVDIWAIGVICLEMITHHPVFPTLTSGDTVRACLAGRQKLPWEEPASAAKLLGPLRGMKRTVLQCLNRDPSQRPTASQLVHSWEHLFDGTVTTGMPESTETWQSHATTPMHGTHKQAV